MTFEEWLKSRNYLTGMLDGYTLSTLINIEGLKYLLEKTWQAGYDQGYEQGIEEVMSK